MTAAISVGTGLALAAGATAVTAGVGIYEANKAAGAQQNAANAAQQTQTNEFNQTNANQAPFRQQGVAADNALASYYGLPGSGPSSAASTIASLPGYQFQLNQGVQAIDRSAASQGLLNSGATGKALAQYGQGLAQNYSEQYVGGLQNLAGLGEGATQSTAAAGANAANQISSAQIYGGQAAASGDVNSFNALASGLNQGIGLYGLAQGQKSPNNFTSQDMQMASGGALQQSPTLRTQGGYVVNNPGYSTGLN